MNRVKGIAFIILSLLLYVVGGATIFTAVRSFTVESTLSAVESAFGTLVIAIILLALGRVTFKAGKARLSQHEES